LGRQPFPVKNIILVHAAVTNIGLVILRRVVGGWQGMAAVGHVVAADVVSILRIRNDGQKLHFAIKISFVINFLTEDDDTISLEVCPGPLDGLRVLLLTVQDGRGTVTLHTDTKAMPFVVF